MHSISHRRNAARALGLAVSSVVVGLSTAPAFSATRPPPVLTDYSILSKIHVNSVTPATVNSPPINGFVPQVIMGLTNQNDPDADSDLYAAIETTLNAGTAPTEGASTAGNPKRWLPSTPGVRYVVATLDTGAQSNIIRYVDVDGPYGFGLTGNFQSSNTATLAGANGTEVADVTNPIGVYFGGLHQASAVNMEPVATGSLNGQYGVSILTASDPASRLPNILGAPVVANYQISILNSQPQTITLNDRDPANLSGVKTYNSPKVSFTSLATNPSLPSNFYRMTLDATSPAGVSPVASYIPTIDFGTFQTVPQTSTFWMSLFANVSGTQDGESIASHSLLFDTGAQVTVFSQDMAAEYGFYSGGPNPSTPDFTVPVEGVGGTSEVPGFYVDQLKVLTNGGYVKFNNVPVLVLDLPDARDGVGYMPGVLGMNLFTDRDLVINGGLTNPSVAFSEQMQWYNNGSGSWSENAKWMLGTPNNVNRPAQFLGKITSAQTITVDNNYTVGSLIFDNVNRYTLSGSGRITLQVTPDLAEASTIAVYSGNHTINAPMTFANAALFNIVAGSTLTTTNDITATNVTITKSGAGTVEMKNVRAGTLVLDAGKVSILPNGTSNATSVVKTLTAGSGNLDLQNNKLIVKGAAGGGTASLGSWNGSAYSGLTGMIASGRNGGSWDGTGIVTGQSNAASNKLLTTLAIATADALGKVGQTFGGQTLQTGDVMVMYTYAGDADLSGKITGDDYFRIDSGFTGNLKGYLNGDFDYNGKINADDYFLIDRNYSAQGATFNFASAPGELSAVPEPASLGLIGIGAALTLRRRRRV